MKKKIFGIFIAIMAVAISTLTTNATNQKRDWKTVVFLGTNQWKIVLPEEEGLTWDCVSGGTTCRGALVPYSSENANGYYDDIDVNYVITYSHYEPI